jgi:hypothetical protein
MIRQGFARYYAAVLTFSMLALGLGCGSAADDISVSDTLPDGSKLSSDDRAAAAFIRAKIAEHWLKGPDGWTTEFQNFNMAGQVMPGVPEVLYRQYRSLGFSVRPEQLTEAMQLNGTDYRGGGESRSTALRHESSVPKPIMADRAGGACGRTRRSSTGPSPSSADTVPGWFPTTSSSSASGRIPPSHRRGSNGQVG